jgi:isoquinoline 1-oxidoreductase beta subunit
MMITEKMLRAAQQQAPAGTAPLSRRRFVTMTVGGSVGLALLPGVAAPQTQQQKPKPGQAPTELPSAFVTIGRDGITTITCNRMDMGQGIETALAMVCAEELGVDWASVRTSRGAPTPSRTATPNTANWAHAPA